MSYFKNVMRFRSPTEGHFKIDII